MKQFASEFATTEAGSGSPVALQGVIKYSSEKRAVLSMKRSCLQRELQEGKTATCLGAAAGERHISVPFTLCSASALGACDH